MIRKLLLALAAILPMVAHAELPMVQDAMIPATAPGATVAAAFMTFHNPGSEAIEITAASSPVIKKVEVHLTQLVDDVMRMEKQDSVEIPAGGSVAFEHGGYHFMLMGLTAPLVEGDVIPLEITTSAGVMKLDVPVGKPKGMSEHDDMKMGDGHDMKMGDGHDMKMGDGHDMKMGDGHDMKMGTEPK